MPDTVAPPDPPPRPDAGGAFVPTLLDQLRARWADPRVGVVMLLVVAVTAGFFWYRSASSGADTPEDDTAVVTAVPGAEPTTTTAPSGPSELVVHVAGAVADPGVVRVPRSARVGDAIEAVGGAAADADIDRLNLAAPLEDGQRVLVARVGDPPSPPPLGPSTSGGGPDDEVEGPIDVNTATPEELEELPGIGPVLAEAIVDERERRGGFRSVNELRDVRGIGEARFADLKDRVRV